MTSHCLCILIFEPLSRLSHFVECILYIPCTNSVTAVQPPSSQLSDGRYIGGKPRPILNALYAHDACVQNISVYCRRQRWLGLSVVNPCTAITGDQVITLTTAACVSTGDVACKMQRTQPLREQLKCTRSQQLKHQTVYTRAIIVSTM